MGQNFAFPLQRKYTGLKIVHYLISAMLLHAQVSTPSSKCNVVWCLFRCELGSLLLFLWSELHSKVEKWVLWPSIPVGHNRNKPPAMQCNAGRASLHGNLFNFSQQRNQRQCTKQCVFVKCVCKRHRNSTVFLWSLNVSSQQAICNLNQNWTFGNK